MPRKSKRKIPKARENDTIEDLQEDGAVGSNGWKNFHLSSRGRNLMDLTSEQIRNKLIEINKGFSTGTIRYDGCLDNLESKIALEIALVVAEQHPFTDGNKRTAIRFCELMLKEKVPEFVYQILERA
ncbi:MAG: Fic family protein [Candidatus Bathyarchaeia archaeon]|jgi:hypothetical protein